MNMNILVEKSLESVAVMLDTSVDEIKNGND